MLDLEEEIQLLGLRNFDVEKGEGETVRKGKALA